MIDQKIFWKAFESYFECRKSSDPTPLFAATRIAKEDTGNSNLKKINHENCLIRKEYNGFCYLYDRWHLSLVY